MANREQKGNKEKRKPKAEKPNAAASQTASFAQPKANAGNKGKKG